MTWNSLPLRLDWPFRASNPRVPEKNPAPRAPTSPGSESVHPELPIGGCEFVRRRRAALSRLGSSASEWGCLSNALRRTLTPNRYGTRLVVLRERLSHGRNGRDPAVDQEVCPDDVRRIVRREVNCQLRDFQRIGHPLAGGLDIRQLIWDLHLPEYHHAVVDGGLRVTAQQLSDHTTAVQSLDHIEDLLLRLGSRRLEIGE